MLQPNNKIIELNSGNSSARILQSGATVSSLVLNGIERLFFNESEDAYLTSRSLCGIPILFPWANRLSEWKIPLDKTINQSQNVRANFHLIQPENRTEIFTDANSLPIHGFLLRRKWHIIEQSDQHLRMKFEPIATDYLIFPFEYDLEMTFVLFEDKLQIRLLIENGNLALPISFGFHPYFRLSSLCDSTNDLRLYLPLHSHIETNDKFLPTGRCEPINGFWPASINGGRKLTDLDGGFFLEPAKSEYEIRVEGPKSKLRLTWSSEFQVTVIYSPANQDFVCIEPMTAPTNSLLQNQFFLDLNDSKSIFDLQWLDPNSKQEYCFEIQSF